MAIKELFGTVKAATRRFEDSSFGVTFYGEKGSMVMAGSKARVLDLNDKTVREIDARGDDRVHFSNFVDAIRKGTLLRAPIEDAEKSTTLCHLGNIAWRSGQTVNFDPRMRTVLGDKKTRALAGRNYRPGWKPKVD